MKDKNQLLKEKDLNQRSIDGALFVEVICSNPNGDPDNGGKPRQNSDGFGIISAVSEKRKLRDLIENPMVMEQARKELGLPKEGFEILESHTSKGLKGELRNSLTAMDDNAFFRRFVDVRLFGCNLLNKDKQEDGDGEEKKNGKAKEKKLNKKIFRGAVQFRHAQSISRINVTIQSVTSKTGTEVGKSQGCGPEAMSVVDHALYLAPFNYRPMVGEAVGTTNDDIRLFMWLLSHMYDANSVNRAQVNIRKIVVGLHNSRIGSFNAFEMYDLITPIRKGNDKDSPSRSMNDYEFSDDSALSKLDGEFFSF